MTDFLLEFSYSVLDIITYYILCSALTKRKMTSTCRRLFFALPFALILALSKLLIKESILSKTSYMFMCICIIYFIFKENIINTIYLYTINYIIVVILQTFLMLFMNHIPGTLTSSKYIFLGSFLTILLESIICIFVPVDKIYAFVKNSSLMVKYIILNIFLLTFISVYTSNISPEYFFQNFYIYFVLIILLLLSFFEIYQSRTQAIEKEKQLDAYTQFLPIVEELITHIRMRQHDFDNELQTLKSLPSICPDYDSLSQNLTSYSEHLSQTTDYSSLLKLNWKLVAGLLFSKEQLAKNSNIDFNIHIINYNLESNIPEYDFIEILGILIDNAFESTKDNGIIHLYMDSIDKKTTIKITNPGYAITPEISASFFSKGYSTKGHNTNSGIGLYKLKTIVDSYHGKIYLYNEKDTAGNTLICFEITA